MQLTCIECGTLLQPCHLWPASGWFCGVSRVATCRQLTMCAYLASPHSATVAFNYTASAALHAGALATVGTHGAHPLAVVNSPVSYADIASIEYYNSQVGHCTHPGLVPSLTSTAGWVMCTTTQGWAELPGVLKHYDLPDVASTLVCGTAHGGGCVGVDLFVAWP